MRKRLAQSSRQILLVISIAMMFVQCTKKNEKPGESMITDTLEHAENYYQLHPAFKEVFEFLKREDLNDLPVGKHEIDGDRVFCSIAKGEGRSRTEAKLEAHRKYIDIQYVISGDEEMGWRPLAKCDDIDQAYDAEKDIEFFNNAPTTWTKVPPGSFAIFFPDDAHAPMVGPGEIHKVIVKIRVES